MQSLNLVFLPFWMFLVGERTPDLTTIRLIMGSIADSSIFSQILIGMLKFDVPFDGIEGPSCLVSLIIHSIVEVTCVADV